MSFARELAYADGKAARLAGLPDTANPYNPRSISTWSAWNHGWDTVTLWMGPLRKESE